MYTAIIIKVTQVYCTWGTGLSICPVGVVPVWKTKFFDEDKLTVLVLVTDEDNFDSSSLFRFRNDPQEFCEENKTNRSFLDD